MGPKLKPTLEAFIRHVNDLNRKDENNEDGFSAEYQMLRHETLQEKECNLHPTEQGALEVNIKKNRYKDILPYDETRVTLQNDNGDDGEDYINANFIRDVVGNEGYIASQGPLPHTVNDFWQMLWQYNIEVIIMVCREVEKAKPKCQRYWAKKSEQLTFGDITVTLLENTSLSSFYNVRRIKACRGDEERILTQFHYTGWLDHDIPVDYADIIELITNVREQQNDTEIPIVVHCSAGCGRTGTICAVDYAWNKLRRGDLETDFSLMDIIREMRSQRPAMVQTPEQYKVAHLAVAHFFQEHLKMMTRHDYENVALDNIEVRPLSDPGDLHIPHNSATRAQPQNYENHLIMGQVEKDDITDPKVSSQRVVQRAILMHNSTTDETQEKTKVTHKTSNTVTELQSKLDLKFPSRNSVEGHVKDQTGLTPPTGKKISDKQGKVDERGGLHAKDVVDKKIPKKENKLKCTVSLNPKIEPSRTANVDTANKVVTTLQTQSGRRFSESNVANIQQSVQTTVNNKQLGSHSMGVKAGKAVKELVVLEIGNDTDTSGNKTLTKKPSPEVRNKKNIKVAIAKEPKSSSKDQSQVSEPAVTPSPRKFNITPPPVSKKPPLPNSSPDFGAASNKNVKSISKSDISTASDSTIYASIKTVPDLETSVYATPTCVMTPPPPPVDEDKDIMEVYDPTYADPSEVVISEGNKSEKAEELSSENVYTTVAKVSNAFKITEPDNGRVSTISVIPETENKTKVSNTVKSSDQDNGKQANKFVVNSTVTSGSYNQIDFREKSKPANNYTDHLIPSQKSQLHVSHTYHELEVSHEPQVVESFTYSTPAEVTIKPSSLDIDYSYVSVNQDDLYAELSPTNARLPKPAPPAAPPSKARNVPDAKALSTPKAAKDVSPPNQNREAGVTRTSGGALGRFGHKVRQHVINNFPHRRTDPTVDVNLNEKILFRNFNVGIQEVQQPKPVGPRPIPSTWKQIM